MALGYAFAEIYKKPEAGRHRLLLKIGLASIAGFIILRAINIYGDPSPWAMQDSVLKSILSFVNVTKYPPSLMFLLIMMGPAFLILAFAEKWGGKLFDVMVMFGRVPLFFYVIHLYVAHLAAMVVGMAQGYPPSTFLNLFTLYPPEYGVGVFGVYVTWLVVVLILYPPSKWYAGVKKRSKSPWLSYF